MQSSEVQRQLDFLKGALAAATVAWEALAAALGDDAESVRLTLVEQPQRKPLKNNTEKYRRLLAEGDAVALAVERECKARNIEVVGAWPTQDRHRLASSDTCLAIARKEGASFLGSVLDLAIELFPHDRRRFTKSALYTLRDFLKRGVPFDRAYMKGAVSGVTIETMREVARRNGEPDGHFLTELVNRSGKAIA